MTGLNRAGFYRWHLPPQATPVEMEIRDQMQRVRDECCYTRPEESDVQNERHHSNNGNGTANGGNGKKENGDANGNGPVPLLVHPFTAWAEALLHQTGALVDVYAALHNASTKQGNQVKPEDVRSLLVTVFIRRPVVRGLSHRREIGLSPDWQTGVRAAKWPRSRSTGSAPKSCPGHNRLS
jgi:hypothetical protein